MMVVVLGLVVKWEEKWGWGGFVCLATSSSHRISAVLQWRSVPSHDKELVPAVIVSSNIATATIFW